VSRQVIGEQVAQGARIAAGLGGAGRVTDAGARRVEEVGQEVFLVVAVAGGGADGVVDFGKMLRLQGEFGEHPGHVGQGE
jgi:hypothetical protein